MAVTCSCEHVERQWAGSGRLAQPSPAQPPRLSPRPLCCCCCFPSTDLPRVHLSSLSCHLLLLADAHLALLVAHRGGRGRGRLGERAEAGWSTRTMSQLSRQAKAKGQQNSAAHRPQAISKQSASTHTTDDAAFKWRREGSSSNSSNANCDSFSSRARARVARNAILMPQLGALVDVIRIWIWI